MAKQRRLSASRMLVQLVEDGIAIRKERERAFFDLANRFRDAKDPAEAQGLGDELGTMVFGR